MAKRYLLLLIPAEGQIFGVISRKVITLQYRIFHGQKILVALHERARGILPRGHSGDAEQKGSEDHGAGSAHGNQNAMALPAVPRVTAARWAAADWPVPYPRAAEWYLPVAAACPVSCRAWWSWPVAGWFQPAAASLCR